MAQSEANRSIEAVWRIESTRLIAGLARFTHGDLGQAEDLAQDALVAALDKWPQSGIPENPAAWLMAAAKNQAIDGARRRQNLDAKYQEVGQHQETSVRSAEDEVAVYEAEVVGDDILSLIFTTCHPVLSTDARAALTLKLLGGLTTEEVARAFIVPKTTMAQRLVRAKRSLTEAKVPFEVPDNEAIEQRLGSVLEVIYLIFNEGYSATSGEDWIRPGLCQEAMRLGRVLVALVPEEPEAHGLLALMEIQASRFPARTDSEGKPVLLLRQDRSKWDRLMLNRGLNALARSESLGVPFGPYTLQAAIAGCHARARKAEETDWPRIVALYDALAQINPSPVIELNRAVAVSMAYGPQQGLDILDRLVDQADLDGYPYLPGVRGDLLQKLGRYDEARMDFELAAELAGNQADRQIMLARASECSS
ncbi:MAG: RNA polymerase sigma factor [Solirubrobacterales bacterium]